MDQPKTEPPVAEPEPQTAFLDRVELQAERRMDGILLGELARLDERGEAWVRFPGGRGAVKAQSTAVLTSAAVGRQVALMFVQGTPERPLILGLIQNPDPMGALEAVVDGERLVISGKKEVELRCGKASILLKESGKIVIKGTHLVSRSSGANKIKGGSVSIN